MFTENIFPFDNKTARQTETHVIRYQVEVVTTVQLLFYTTQIQFPVIVFLLVIVVVVVPHNTFLSIINLNHSFETLSKDSERRGYSPNNSNLSLQE